MLKFLYRCKELQIDGTSETELQDKIEQLKAEVQVHNNAYITALLAQT
jgi:hypothetical protein